MKNFYLLVIFFLSLFSVFSQTGSVTLTFIGEYADSHNNLPLESVYIQNTTLGCDTTIYGATPSIVLQVPTGIRELTYSTTDPFMILPPIPNPFIGTTHVDIQMNDAGTLHITVLNAQGKVVSEYKAYYKIGIHRFKIESSVPEFLLLNVSNGSMSKSMKLINNSTGMGDNRITFLGSEHQNLKSNPSVPGFTFRIGNQLLYKSIKSGYYDKIIIDSPIQNSSYTFELNPIIIKASVLTADVTNITQTTATSGGDVTSDGGAPVTARGVCWSISSYPTTADNHTISGSDTGTFVSTMTGLTGGTNYFVRAYAINSAGTSYGNEVTFITLTLPAVTTNTVTNITETTAISGGTVTSDGGDPVIARGVCWSTSSNPTTAGNHTINGSDTGTFVSTLTGLTAGTIYYVRAYATNSAGTSYGNEVTFITLTLPTVTTDTVTNITETTAISGGTVTSDGGTPVTTRGVCCSISPNPTIADNYTIDGSGTGNFVSNLTGLATATFYHVRAYATNSLGTSYGNEVTFITLTLPTVTTDTVTNITETTAIGWGTVTSDGGTPVTTRGVCWSTSSNPTITDNHTTDGGGTGNFVSNITGLAPATFYYVRAYATNSLGTMYGNELAFFTLTLPTVTTDTINNITESTAIGWGTVTSDGGTPVTVRGVCWSTSSNPTIADDHTTDGSGTGNFVSNMTGLVPSTFYYVRAYATNNLGTSYGNELNFTTAWVCGYPITIYHETGSIAPVTKTVTYSTATSIPGESSKCWITSNLGADHQATSVDDPTEASAGWYWQFNRKQGYKHDGATRTPNTTWISSISENLDWLSDNDPCSFELGVGWRIPTATEWTNVDEAGGWTNWIDAWNSDLKLHAAGHLKNIDGSLNLRGSGGSYWSSTQYSIGESRQLGFLNVYCYVGGNSKAYGFSLRCIKE